VLPDSVGFLKIVAKRTRLVTCGAAWGTRRHGGAGVGSLGQRRFGGQREGTPGGLIFGRCLWSALLKLRQQPWSCLTTPAGGRQRA